MPVGALAEAAPRHGVRSSLSAPLTLEDQTFGALNLYGGTEEAFREDDEHVAALVASYAAVVAANARAYWSARETAEHLARAMESRAEIEQAKGILMAQARVSADEAFDLLRRASQRENRRLRNIASEIVARVAERAEH